MIVLIIFLWILPGLDKVRVNGWYQTIPQMWRRVVTMLFDIAFGPISVTLDLIREFGKTEEI